MLSRRAIVTTVSVLVSTNLGAQQTAPTALTLGDAARLAAKQSTPALAAQFRARYHALEGVVFIGVAQERQFSFKATKRIVPPHAVPP